MQAPPCAFFDKVFWLSLHTDTSQWSACADKLAVRERVSHACGASVLPKLYATYDSAQKIDFSRLPEQFVLKTNNGCGTNWIIRDRSATNLEVIRKELSYWLGYPYGALTGQGHYSRIVPRIFAEELLQSKRGPSLTPDDFKFFCFDGVPCYCLVASNRKPDSSHTYDRMMYDMDWHPIPEAFESSGMHHGGIAEIQPRPQAFDTMIEMARTLSKGFSFVRVDLYEVDGEAKFGEMTFTPGMGSCFTEDFQRELGDLIELPSLSNPLSRQS